jgi:predicted DNA-binding transcriptional regulator YafY
MATNKNALLRYQTLDRCFRNPGKKYFWEDLLEECNIQLREYNGEQSMIARRQLFKDINFMESEAGWSVPLERYKEGRKVFYRYSDLDFSINNQPLNESEVNTLQSGMAILSRFQGLPQMESLKELIPKLQKGAGPQTLAPIIGFDENPYLKGLEYIGELFNAILYKTVLSVQYQDFKAKEPYEITFHPYYLKQYNNRWFVFGLNEEFGIDNWNLSLDRIQEIKSNRNPYQENTSIDWNEYFEDIIGVTKSKEDKPIDIELWFHPTTANYIVTKPIHGSQKQKSFDESGLIIRLNLIPNFEFYQRIMSFGDMVKVLSPDLIIEKAREKLETSLAYYS